MTTDEKVGTVSSQENKAAYDYLYQTAQESIETKNAFLKDNAEALIQAAQKIAQCIKDGGKLLICGNGGSASDAQHMAAEMVGRMLVDRKPLAAIALTTDTSILTAVSNDFSYDQIFSKQVQALAQSKDLLLAISTSGKSPNVIEAAKAAKEKGCFVVSLTGKDGGVLKSQSDLNLNVSLGKNSSRIQESHIFAIHTLVDLGDRFFHGQ